MGGHLRRVDRMCQGDPPIELRFRKDPLASLSDPQILELLGAAGSNPSLRLGQWFMSKDDKCNLTVICIVTMNHKIYKTLDY